jgi:hypothetical protein
MFLQNISIYLQGYMVSQPRRSQSEQYCHEASKVALVLLLSYFHGLAQGLPTVCLQTLQYSEMVIWVLTRILKYS